MLARRFGREIKTRRAAAGIAQETLCRKAGVSRAVLSKLENEHGSPVQTDILDRLVSALGADLHVNISDGAGGQAVERLRNSLRQAELRERHLRLALDLCLDRKAAQAKIRRALQQVQLWQDRRTCSPDYVRRWRKALSGDALAVAAAMTSFGEWENAMYQNSPWSFEWT